MKSPVQIDNSGSSVKPARDKEASNRSKQWVAPDMIEMDFRETRSGGSGASDGGGGYS